MLSEGRSGLLSVRPFRVGDRVRFQAGALAGQIEGTVSQLGLLYVTLSHGQDVVMIPNNTLVQAAITPEVIMRVTATPLSDADGPKLADEVLQALNAVTAPETAGNGLTFGQSR